MEISAGRMLEILAVVVLSAYFPILTYSFFKYRLQRKQEELLMLMERINLISDFNEKSLSQRLDKEYAKGDYVLPVSFITALTFIGVFLLFLSWIIYDFEPEGYSSILFSGADFWRNSNEYVVEKRSVAVLAFAITGSYISSARYIYRRFTTVDLTPGNYFSVGLRTILAALVSIMLSFVLPETNVADGNLLIVLAFLIGLFPDSGLRLLINKVNFFPKGGTNNLECYALEQIQGVSELHKIRLNEVGIDNVQNLAQYSFVMLIIKTPFPVRTLLDWTAQAKLIMEFGQEYTSLQKAGIRTALDLLDACELKGDRFQEISTICGINKLSIEINYDNLKKDQSVVLLDHFRKNLEHFKLDSAAD